MLGAAAGAIVGGSLAHWISMPADAAAAGVPPVGSLETTACRRVGDTVVTFPCEFTVSVLPVVGQESGFVGTLRDLTDRRTAEQQLCNWRISTDSRGCPTAACSATAWAWRCNGRCARTTRWW
jgi:hypothetical protein